MHDIVGIGGFGSISPQWPTVRLVDRCPTLESLTLGVLLADFSRFPKADTIFQWRYTMRVVSAAPFTLKQLTFMIERGSLNLRADFRLELLPWSALDRVLQSIPDLVSVKFIEIQAECTRQKFVMLGSRPPLEEGLLPDSKIVHNLEGYIREQLPLSQEGGVIHFPKGPVPQSIGSLRHPLGASFTSSSSSLPRLR